MERGSRRITISPDRKGTLGTFPGVFTPSILTILGIILFLRLGYVVGNAGLGRALVIIGLANLISILTSFSLSAIATNMKVKGGGDYYLISRTLGVEFGGAIGIVLFLAQSVSIAFYCIGFGEAVAAMFQGNGKALPQIIAALAVSFLFVFAWLGADWATRFQYLVMTILAVALFSFFAGGLAKWENATLLQNCAPSASGPGFWVLFAIFFPAVTGFTQGVSMSGDLKDPGKSLPLGTFLAVGVSIIVYFGAAVVFASALPSSVLAGDYGAMKRAALSAFLINAGVVSATLSSGMASFLGAPRILQSVATDRIFPFLLPFAKGSGPTGNPRRAVLLACGIAFATVGLGKLNLIAPVVSMFFLISYGLLNYATFFEARASSPSFRPRFRWFHPRLSLLGWLACLGAVLAIDLRAGAAAIAVLFAIYQYLKRTAGPARWADSRRSYHFQHIREHLLAAASEPEHPRDWRPQLLAFSDDSPRRERLLRFASWLEGGSGLTTVVRILEGEGLKMLRLKEEAEEELRKSIAQYGLKAFPLVVVAPNLQVGIHTLVQAFGIGPLRANTILLNWLEQAPKGVLGVAELRYARSLREAFRFGCNIVVLDADETEWAALETLPPNERRIDVWWWGDATSRLMLLLAYLMTRNEDWDGAKIRVLAASHDRTSEETIEGLKRTLQEVRIEADPEIVKGANFNAIVEHSADAALVFLPFRLRGHQVLGPFDHQVDDLILRLPVVALALAAEDIDLDAEPEEGQAGELAAALDSLADAKKKALEAEKEAAEASEEAEKKLQELESAVVSGEDEDIMARVNAAIEAKEKSSKAARRAAKAMAKMEDAAREAEALGAEPDGERGESEPPSNPEKSKDPNLP
ncbi:MAG: amino acid permease [Desulfobacteraceae bacterium]